MSLKVGFVGWRGMVGSVLMNRMFEEGDFDSIKPSFFTTSSPGKEAPFSDKLGPLAPLADAKNIDALMENDVIITCQGGDYTKEVYPKLREAGFKGHWVDAASALRMESDSCLILDPINLDLIKDELSKGTKSFVGSNCTVSLMLLAIQGLVKNDLVEWVSSMTYQAASGGGAQNMKELLAQMHFLSDSEISDIKNPNSDILSLDKKVKDLFFDPNFPQEKFGAALAGSLIPWIDSEANDPNTPGQTREEWKAMAEANKILATDNKNKISIDGTCVRIGAMRSHSQALTIKLKRDVAIEEINEMIKSSHQWIEFVENTPEATKARLNPAYTSGTMKIAVGRVRKMNLGPEYLNVFTVGDQLLWGAAEPLRRMLKIIQGEI